MRGVKFIEERRQAVLLRKRGFSIVEIEKKLQINRSTLSGWFKGIKLSMKAGKRLRKHRDTGLLIARGKAVIWHNVQKAKRLAIADVQAKEIFDKLPVENEAIVDLPSQCCIGVKVLKQPAKLRLEILIQEC